MIVPGLVIAYCQVDQYLTVRSGGVHSNGYGEIMHAWFDVLKIQPNVGTKDPAVDQDGAQSAVRRVIDVCDPIWQGIVDPQVTGNVRSKIIERYRVNKYVVRIGDVPVHVLNEIDNRSDHKDFHGVDGVPVLPVFEVIFTHHLIDEDLTVRQVVVRADVHGYREVVVRIGRDSSDIPAISIAA